MEETPITPEYQAEIDAAQDLTHETIAGRQFARVRYGDAPDEKGPNLKPRCCDCAAQIGQFHVIPCCMEPCPVCGGQALGCDCYTAAEGVQ
jgi:hypothetical protein